MEKKNQGFIGIPRLAPDGAGDLFFDDRVFLDR